MIALMYSSHKPVLMGIFSPNLLNIDANNQVLMYYLSMLPASFYPLAVRSTRVSSRSATLIDHICSTYNELIKKTWVILNDISDYFLTFACFDLTVQKPDGFSKYTRRVGNK